MAASQHVQNQGSSLQAVKTGQEECQNLLLEHTWITKVPPSYLSVLSSGWHCSIKTQLNHLLTVSTNKAFKDVMHELKKKMSVCAGDTDKLEDIKGKYRLPI